MRKTMKLFRIYCIFLLIYSSLAVFFCHGGVKESSYNKISKKWNFIFFGYNLKLLNQNSERALHWIENINNLNL